jgi:hypothetical protein
MAVLRPMSVAARPAPVAGVSLTVTVIPLAAAGSIHPRPRTLHARLKDSTCRLLVKRVPPEDAELGKGKDLRWLDNT